MSKDIRNIYIAPVLVMISFLNFNKEEAIANLFGLGMYALAMFIIILFLWYEIRAVLEPTKAKRQKILTFFAALSGLIFTPLMVIIISCQYWLLYKTQFEENNQETPIKREFKKSDIVQYYLLAVGSLIAGSARYLYFVYSTVKI